LRQANYLLEGLFLQTQLEKAYIFRKDLVLY